MKSTTLSDLQHTSLNHHNPVRPSNPPPLLLAGEPVPADCVAEGVASWEDTGHTILYGVVRKLQQPANSGLPGQTITIPLPHLRQFMTRKAGAAAHWHTGRGTPHGTSGLPTQHAAPDEQPNSSNTALWLKAAPTAHTSSLNARKTCTRLVSNAS